MWKEMSVIILGFFLAALPYIGIPKDFKTILTLFMGLAVALLGFLLRGEALARARQNSEHQPFVESSRRTKGHTASAEDKAA